MTSRVYLDWNATAPLRPEARAAMAQAWDIGGNPSSVHAEGRRARKLVEDVRAAIAEALGAEPRNVIFTSGGTEANALALMPGLRRGSSLPVRRLLVSAVEHPSVLAGGRYAPSDMAAVAADRSGVVDLDSLRALLQGGPPALVSVMAANNETGAIQPVAEIADIVHQAGCVLHVDAVQALGKIPLDIKSLKVDLISVSAHKIGGPKGVGALILADGLNGLEPAIRGGGQEKGRRAGTENVPGIAGFGAAVTAALGSFERDMNHVANLRRRLETGLKQHPDVVIFSEQVPRLPNTTLFAAPGISAETTVIGFDLEGVAISSGSACSSGKVQPSHVLAAMGVAPDLIRGAMRLSLGWETSEADIDRTLEAWIKLSGVLLKAQRNTA